MRDLEDGSSSQSTIVDPSQRPYYVRVLPSMTPRPSNPTLPPIAQQPAASDDWNSSFEDNTIHEDDHVVSDFEESPDGHQAPTFDEHQSGVYAAPWRTGHESVRQTRVPPTYDDYMNRRRITLEQERPERPTTLPITPPPDHKSHSNRCRCIAVLILVIVLIIIAVAVGLTVYFLLHNSSSNSQNSESSNLTSTLQTTTMTTTTPYQVQSTAYNVTIPGVENAGPFIYDRIHEYYIGANVAEGKVFIGNTITGTSHDVDFTRAKQFQCTKCTIYTANPISPSEDNMNYCCAKETANDPCEPFCYLQNKTPIQAKISEFCGIEPTADESSLNVCAKINTKSGCSVTFYKGLNYGARQTPKFTHGDPGACPSNSDVFPPIALAGINSVDVSFENSAFAYLIPETSSSKTLYVEKAGTVLNANGIRASELLLTSRSNALQITLSEPGGFISVYVFSGNDNKLTFISQLSPAIPWDSISVAADGTIMTFAKIENHVLSIERYSFDLPHF